jgi:hypothetical protein
MPRRETIIALRARHTAFRLATDILYPPPPSAPPPAALHPPSETETVDATPAIDVLAEFESWEWQQRQERRDKRMRRLVVLLWMTAIVVGAWNWPRKSSPRPLPPPPQARPILRAQ